MWENQIKDSKLKEVADKQHAFSIDTYRFKTWFKYELIS